MKLKQAELVQELGEVWPKEKRKYKKLNPDLDMDLMLGTEEGLKIVPYKGIFFGLILSIGNIAMSNYRQFEATNVMSPLIKNR